MYFANYTQLGTSRPANSAADVTTRGTYGLNDVFTAAFGKHTLKGGFEWKKAGTSIHNGSNLGGTFNFAEDTTGNTATGDTGDDMASFYLGAASSASTNYYNVLAEYPRQYGYAAHFGDEWRVSPKLIANLSIRWDICRMLSFLAPPRRVVVLSYSACLVPPFAARADSLFSITGDAFGWISADGLAIGWLSPVETTDLTISVLLQYHTGSAERGYRHISPPASVRV